MMPPLSDSKLFNHPELDVSPIRFKRDTMNQKLLNLSDVHRSIMTKKETDIVNSNTENIGLSCSSKGGNEGHLS